ncbi:MAG: 3-dehydroquinate synthase [Alphaproteobacteria bacterium]
MSTEAPADERLTVALDARSYDIVIGSGLIGRAGALMRPVLAGPRVVVVTDTAVGPLYGDALAASLSAAGLAHETVTVPAGEASKDFVTLAGVVDSLLASRVERSTTLVALGGGVIGDLTGFAASILLRGIDFVQVPTTLLAQVDSSVGGKTGINTPRGKNLVGAFHQPRLVLADVAALDSLPRRELLAGYAEVVKYGLLGDAPFFDWLEQNGAALLAGDLRLRVEAVRRSCAAKAAIVAEDERETGQRALLNLGHTFGHALEAEVGYDGRLLHGEAVAIGMAMAFALSARLGLGPDAAAVARIRRHLAGVGLPTSPPALAGVSWDPDRLIDHMTRDKKVRDGRITFILARAIGQAEVRSDVSVEAVRAVLEDSAEAA